MRAVLGWLLGIDDRVTGSRSLEPPADHPVACDLWSGMSEDHRRRLQTASFWIRPVESPADAVVQRALLDHRERRHTANRWRWLAVWGVFFTFMVAVNVTAFGVPRPLFAVAAVLPWLGGAAVIAAVQIRRWRVVRELIDARAALYEPDTSTPTNPSDTPGGSDASTAADSS